MIFPDRRQAVFLLLAVACVLGGATSTHAQLRLRDISRLKGQEPNTLHGMGLVVGLKATGDGSAKPTARALATMLKLMGNPVAKGAGNQAMLQELKDFRNVALVIVTTTVPAAGAAQGDTLNCNVSALSAKSLDGGYLLMTPLLGPRPGNNRIYGIAQGPIHLENKEQPASGTVHKGCRLEETFTNKFISEDGKITLVLDKNHASFATSLEVADLINSTIQSGGNQEEEIAKPQDQVNVVVKIPPAYLGHEVEFVSEILKQPIYELKTEALVIINERTGIIVIGSEVAIGSVVVSHKNIIVEVGGDQVASKFVGIDTLTNATPKLNNLVSALEAVRLPTKDIIEVIKRLERCGKIFGKVIIE